MPHCRPALPKKPFPLAEIGPSYLFATSIPCSFLSLIKLLKPCPCIKRESEFFLEFLLDILLEVVQAIHVHLQRQRLGVGVGVWMGGDKSPTITYNDPQ